MRPSCHQVHGQAARTCTGPLPTPCSTACARPAPNERHRRRDPRFDREDSREQAPRAACTTGSVESVLGAALVEPKYTPVAVAPPPAEVALEMEGPVKLHRMVSHLESGIEEEENRDGHADPWHLALLDTHDYSCGVLLWRLILFTGFYIVAGFYITFSNQGSSINDYWGVGLGALCAYALVFLLMAVEAFVVHPWYYNKLKGQIGLPMVHWFTWTVFIDMIYMFVHPGFKGDVRITEYAGKIGEPAVETTTADNGDLWMDFCADVGDGFNPTYAVFSSMSRAMIQVGPHKLPRPQITLVGGDIAYPWPRYEDVMARFIRPLAWSFPSGHGHNSTASKFSSLYVLPGNHEYMDGLRNFRALVLNRDTVGMYRVKNKTPYFAIHLPKHSYWIFCLDMGSDDVQDMDDFQIAYFTEIIQTKTRPSDNFMCVLHEPDWIKNGAVGYDLFAKLAHFRKNVLGERLRITVAGDIHHYRRMEETENPGSRSKGTVVYGDSSEVATYRRQLVVAGNGGAFSHPTDVPHVSSLRLGEPHIKDGPIYVNKKCHPSEEESRDIFNNRFCFGFSFGKNYGFGSIVGLLYMGMMLSVSPNDYSPGAHVFPTGLQAIDNAEYLLRTITSRPLLTNT